MLYFAYGSNLWLQQMASRCPGCYLVGRGVLYNYRWQINERGFANVVSDSSSCVHGLVYGISPADEASLDRSEGVGTGAYTRSLCNVVLHPAAYDLQKSPNSVLRALDAGQNAAAAADPPPPYLRDMLVYLSTTFVHPGRPRDEYIGRIHAGIQDAIALGVPPDFFTTVVRPLVPPAPPGQSDQPSQRGGGRRLTTTRILPLPAAASRLTRSRSTNDTATQSRYRTPRSPPTASRRVPYNEHKGRRIVEVIDVDEADPERGRRDRNSRI